MKFHEPTLGETRDALAHALTTLRTLQGLGQASANLIEYKSAEDASEAIYAVGMAAKEIAAMERDLISNGFHEAFLYSLRSDDQ